MAKVLVLFYSSYGHVWKLAESVLAGAKEVANVQADLKRVPETLSEEILTKLGSLDVQKKMAHIPVAEVEDLTHYDAIVFGTPTRFGNMCGQMKQFFDACGKLWIGNKLVGKVASVFTSTGSQHGGQESTILSTHIPLLHLGFILVGLPYSFKEQMREDEITGCSPYGASTIAGQGKREPTANELAGAHFQGRHVATIASKLF